MRVYISQIVSQLSKLNYFQTTDKETCVPGRAIPIGEMWAKFLNGENIVDPRMRRELSYQTIENNPYYRKGFDLADTPSISQSVRESVDNANNMLQNELSVKDKDVESKSKDNVSLDHTDISSTE